MIITFHFPDTESVIVNALILERDRVSNELMIEVSKHQDERTREDKENEKVTRDSRNKQRPQRVEASSVGGRERESE